MEDESAITLMTVYQKLFTNEDIRNVHKILGVSSMICVCARLRYAGSEHDMGFRTWPEYTVATILLHWLAVVSSLVFKIPVKRIKQGNRLWPQARLHNICFVSRHLGVVFLYYMEARHGWEPNYLLNYAIVMLTMIAADISTASVKFKSNTIRDVEAHPAAKYFFTAAQFGATSNILLGLRRSSLHYYIVFVIQLTAFLTTLRRKNLANHKVLVFLYGLQILLGGYLNFTDLYQAGGSAHVCFLFNATTRLVHLIRVAGPAWFGLLKSKYVLWTMAAVFLHYSRPFGPSPHPFALWLAEPTPAFYVQLASAVLMLGTLYHGYVVTQGQLPAFRALKKVE